MTSLPFHDLPASLLVIPDRNPLLDRLLNIPGYGNAGRLYVIPKSIILGFYSFSRSTSFGFKSG